MMRRFTGRSAAAAFMLLCVPACAPATAVVAAPAVEDRRDELRRLLDDRLRSVEHRLRRKRTEAALEERLVLVVARHMLEDADPDESWTLPELVARAEARVERRRQGGADVLGFFADDPPPLSQGSDRAFGRDDDVPAQVAIDDLEEIAEPTPPEEVDAWHIQPAPMGAMVQAQDRGLPSEVKDILLAQGARLRLCAVELRDEVRFEVRAQLYGRRLRGVVVDAAPSQPAVVTDCVAEVFASLDLPAHGAPTQSVLFPFIVRP